MAYLQCCFFAKSLMRTVDVTVILPTDKVVPGQSEYAPQKPLKTLYLLHGGSGDDSDYVKFIGEDLVEFTRRSFPLSHAREDTFIGGLSMGGYGAIRNGLVYGDTFGAIVGLSSALVLENAAHSTYDNPSILGNRHYYESIFGDLDALPGSNMDPYALVQKCIAEGKTPPKMYLACGTEDAGILPCNEAFHAFLLENGVEHTYVTAPGTHSWTFWDTFIEKALDWLPLGDAQQGLSSGHIAAED